MTNSQEVTIPLGTVTLEGFLDVPNEAKGLVIFVHGSGSSRHSPRNQYVARELQKIGMATLLADLLTEAEDADYRTRFNIQLLTTRVKELTAWARGTDAIAYLPMGYFGASTGAAAALDAAAELGDDIKAIVSRGGRPDLASHLEQVRAPTLFIVGAEDYQVIELNKQAFEKLRCEKELKIVPGATHLFEEPGTLEEVARLSADWFAAHLPSVWRAG